MAKSFERNEVPDVLNQEVFLYGNSPSEQDDFHPIGMADMIQSILIQTMKPQNTSRVLRAPIIMRELYNIRTTTHGGYT